MNLLRFLGTFTVASLGWAGVAQAQYAVPPSSPVVVRTGRPAPDPYVGCGDLGPPPGPLFHVATGPAVRVGAAEPTGGLLLALDIGRRSTGFRASAAWMGVGQDQGVGQYTGELWIDFGVTRRLHPIVGAGGGLARVDLASADEGLSTTSVGIGVLRPGVQYALPVRGTDARVGAEVLGVLPAVHASDAPRIDPWLVGVATVSLGF
jgi:hypothetical protein